MQFGRATLQRTVLKSSLSKVSVRAMSSKHAHVQEPRWWDENTVAVVTGANKGLGLEAARQLAGEAGMTTVLTARNEKAGHEALESLRQSCGDKARLDFHQLDITSPDSIKAFKSWLEQKYGKLTVLVNNAGMAYKGNIFGPEETRATLATNYYGTADLTEALLPLMPTDGTARVFGAVLLFPDNLPSKQLCTLYLLQVTVASRAGLTSILKSPELKERFMNAKGRAEIDQLASEWQAGVDNGDFGAKGWPGSMYGVSKLAINSYCKAKAKELEGKKIMLNSCCPGYCDTDMTSHRGPKSAYDGARIFTWLATKPPQDFETGSFWIFDGTGVKYEM